jgi:hypothetical protein
MLRGPVSVATLLVAVGCGGTVSGFKGRDDTSTEKPGAGVSTSPTTSNPGGANAASSDPGGSKSVASGAGGTKSITDPAGSVPSDSPAIDCLHGDVGPASPDLFVQLTHERQVCDGPGSDCIEYMEMDADCSLMFQVNNEARKATADAADCAALARFATSSFLVAGLNDATTCLPGSGNPMEITTTELTTGAGPRKKSSLCQEEPLISLRACLAAVERKYF